VGTPKENHQNENAEKPHELALNDETLSFQDTRSALASYLVA
jgi:hypothetical protein